MSFAGGPSVTIKSHHNVGGLPERMRMGLVEPLRDRLEDDALEEERKAEKALHKLESVLFAKGDDAVPSRALTKLAEKHAGTKAAARASHLAGLLADG